MKLNGHYWYYNAEVKEDHTIPVETVTDLLTANEGYMVETLEGGSNHSLAFTISILGGVVNLVPSRR